MVLVCGSTSVTFPSTSAPPFSPSKSSITKSPFLGFQLASSKSSLRSSVPVNSRGSLQGIWNKTWYPKAADHVNTDKP